MKLLVRLTPSVEIGKAWLGWVEKRWPGDFHVVVGHCLSRGSICPKTLSSRSLPIVRLSHRPSQLALYRVEWQVISFLGVALKAAMVIDRDVIANGDKYNGSAS